MTIGRIDFCLDELQLEKEVPCFVSAALFL